MKLIQFTDTQGRQVAVNPDRVDYVALRPADPSSQFAKKPHLHLGIGGNFTINLLCSDGNEAARSDFTRAVDRLQGREAF